MIPVLFRFPDWIPLLGDQAVTSFGALLLVAFVAGGALFVRGLRTRGHAVVPVGASAAGWDVVVAAALGGLIGAKLLHVGIHAGLDLPSGVLGRGGLNWFGGLIGGAAAGFWRAGRAGVPRGHAAGAAAPALALGYAIGRVGSFLVGADYGRPTTLPWGVAFRAGTPPTTAGNLTGTFDVAVPAASRVGDFVRVHPTQLYEALLSLLILFALLRQNGEEREAGGWRLLGLFLILHGCARMAVELIRAKQDRIAGAITADLLLAAAVVVAGTALRRPQRTVPRATESS